MVTRQSPAGSGRFGATFLQILMYKCALFQGRPVDNSFPGFICHHLFDPKLGEDRVLIPDDGTPALLLWLHVDDILLHGPTLSKVEEGLYFVLAEAQRLGLIYQPVKLMPPTQCLKFCGFLYDTHGVPTLLFELARHSLLLTSCNGTHTSVLLITPGYIRSSFLQGLYADLFRLKDSPLLGTRSYYFTSVDLLADAHGDLIWWSYCKFPIWEDWQSLGAMAVVMVVVVHSIGSIAMRIWRLLPLRLGLVFGVRQ